jgi:hypothetical protein
MVTQSGKGYYKRNNRKKSINARKRRQSNRVGKKRNKHIFTKKDKVGSRRIPKSKNRNKTYKKRINQVGRGITLPPSDYSNSISTAWAPIGNSINTVLDIINGQDVLNFDPATSGSLGNAEVGPLA